MMTQNLWDSAKAVLRGRFIAIKSYLKKQEKHQIHSLTLLLKQLEKEKQKPPKVNRRKEIIKIGAEISEKEMKETIEQIQFSSVTQSSLILCDPMNHSTPGLPVHHQLPEFTQTHVHQVGDTIQPSHPLSSPSPPDHNPSQHQSLFQWVNSSHEVAKVLEFQL